ncbi:MAG: TIGR00159 family protein [Caldiserica bacterium]|nr:MAG: TIGR00159 family protein [Caldisericota bacterium]
MKVNQFFKILLDFWRTYLVHIVDIVVVAFLVYKVLSILKGTRTENILRGMIILLIMTLIARFLGLKVLFWILKGFWVAGIVALVIVFQPELRFLLSQIGRGKVSRFFLRRGYSFIDEIIDALIELKNKGHGALVVFEFEIGLRNYIDTGIRLNSEISKELLVSIFTPPSPLHDGAVIIRGEKIISASCILPLSNEPGAVELLGTRHRAAIGITEVSDCLSIVLSEETGAISIARAGKLKKNVNPDEIKKSLLKLYNERVEKKVGFEQV